jgi:hypothetical protein
MKNQGDKPMKTKEEVKAFVDKKLKEKNLAMNDVSQMIGKQGTYLYQFINRKSPQRLPETERKMLAQILDVSEQDLTDIPLTTAHMVFHSMSDKISSQINPQNVSIDILDATPCCGNGIEAFQENVIGQWSMPLFDFKTISTTSNPDNVKMLRVKGDSMAPTIKDADWVLVDTSFHSPDSDGIYLLKISTGLAIKRLQGSVGNNIIIISDNPKYPPVTAASGDVQICGKIIYTLSAEKVG